MPTPKPRPAHLRVVGTKAAKAVPIDPAMEVVKEFDNGLQPPKKLTAAQQKLWDAAIRTAPWLTKFDIYTAHQWVVMQARFLKDDEKFTGIEQGHLRSLRGELGFDPSARTKMKVPMNAKTKASKYFD